MAEWRETVPSLWACNMGSTVSACCWVLMCLLFVGGLNEPCLGAGLAIYVALEKIGPAGPLLGRLAGAGLLAWSARVAASRVRRRRLSTARAVHLDLLRGVPADVAEAGGEVRAQLRSGFALDGPVADRGRARSLVQAGLRRRRRREPVRGLHMLDR